MKYGSIVIAVLFLADFTPMVRAQGMQANGARDRQIIRHPDSDRFMTDVLRKSSIPALAKSSPHSRVSVIDTAVVRSFADTTRHTYSFDARAKMTSDLTQILKGEVWIDIVRNTYTHDANGNNLSESYEEFSNGQWVTRSRYAHTYGADGRKLSDLEESWSNGQLDWAARYTYTYDANGNNLSVMYEGLSNGQWVTYSRSTYIYDAGGEKLSGLDEFWRNGQWTNGARYAYTYDTNGDMLSETREEWSNSHWVVSYRGAYSYDADGNMISRTRVSWWPNGQGWNGDRATFTYNARGDKLSELHEWWSDRGADWVFGQRYTWAYDSTGHILLRLEEYWQNSQWVSSVRFVYTYDAQGDLASRWRYGWLNSSWTPMDDPEPRPWLLDPVIDGAGNVYWLERGYNFDLTHTLIVTGVASEGGNIAATYSLSQNYPNPFNPSTTIRYGLPSRSHVTLAIFNTLGQQVATLVQGEQGAGFHEAVFDASGFASGVYLCRLQAGDFTQIRKLLLVK